MLTRYVLNYYVKVNMYVMLRSDLLTEVTESRNKWQSRCAIGFSHNHSLLYQYTPIY